MFSFDLGHRSSVALHHTGDKFVSWTGSNFQMYNLVSDNLELMQTFSSGTDSALHYPRDVSFGEHDEIIVGGTDRGCGLIYSCGSPDVLQTLNYPKGGLVQCVSVSIDLHYFVLI